MRIQFIYCIQADTASRMHNGHEYLVIMEKLDFKSSQEACTDLGGHLVIISDQTENEFVVNLAARYDIVFVRKLILICFQR